MFYQRPNDVEGLPHQHKTAQLRYTTTILLFTRAHSLIFILLQKYKVVYD